VDVVFEVEEAADDIVEVVSEDVPEVMDEDVLPDDEPEELVTVAGHIMIATICVSLVIDIDLASDELPVSCQWSNSHCPYPAIPTPMLTR
jgi:hypothetical protein